MIRVHCLSIPEDRVKRLVLVVLGVNKGDEIACRVEGGPELQNFFHNYHTLECSTEDFRVAVALVKKGVPLIETLKSMNPS